MYKNYYAITYNEPYTTQIMIYEYQKSTMNPNERRSLLQMPSDEPFYSFSSSDSIFEDEIPTWITLPDARSDKLRTSFEVVNINPTKSKSPPP